MELLQLFKIAASKFSAKKITKYCWWFI
jgi:hypothetical protein